MSDLEIDDTSETEPVLIMRRTFAAPRELVWRALTTPAQVPRGYGGHGFENPVCEMDVRPGGRWRHVMRTPDGSLFPSEHVFLEVVPPEKLVWQPADAGGGGPHDCVLTVTLEARGARTLWTLVTRFRSFADREAARGIGFARVLGEGTEKFAAIVEAGAGLAADGPR